MTRRNVIFNISIPEANKTLTLIGRISLLFFLLILSSSPLYAPGPPPSTIPVDGGLNILIVMGAIYGSRKLYKAIKNR